MKKVLLLPYLLIGFSYTFLLYNKIFFGVSLVLGILSLFFIQKDNFSLRLKFSDNKINLFFFLTIFFFLISSLISIKPERSILVIIYFVFFIIISLNLFNLLIKSEDSYKKILNFFIISTIINILIIFFYNIYESEILIGNLQIYGIKKYKGILSIISILVLLLFFFKKSKLFLIPLVCLIPSLYLSDSSSPIVGFLTGIFVLIFFKVIAKIKLTKIKVLILSIIFISIVGSFVKELPNKFDQNSIDNQNFTIPISLLDAHRQFIWGFSLSKFFEKPFFGFGPDTSNFIEEGQKQIGSKFTGTMNFIPSHPHNFFIELLLETGLAGTLSFIIFILILNYKIMKRANSYQKNFVIFFNGYFWGASLVNFSYWQAWWQCSYFLILSFITAHIFHTSSKFLK